MSNGLSKRRALLDQLRRVLPPCPQWEAWLTETGELPPDFDQLPSHASLPDPLIGEDGAAIVTREGWQAQREHVREKLKHWIVGQFPPAPDHLGAAIVNEHKGEDGTIQREVRLTFGPEGRATLRLWLFIPPVGKRAKSPVFLTQASHRNWALIAVRRGYLACIYAAADGVDDTDTFDAAYPGYDWSRLMRRAWAGSRCIDYLATLAQAKMSQIAITGHSRNGKQALMTAAFDDRVSLVISSSSGGGGVLSARDFGEQHFGEGIELITRRFPDWFHPRLRFFTGREDKLPVDIPDLVALVAPRQCLLSIALNDSVESSWAMQQTYLHAQKVYDLYHASSQLKILWRPGSHETWSALIEHYLDWCDNSFGRMAYLFSHRLLHPHDWETWRRYSPTPPDVDAFPIRSLASRTGAATISDWQHERQDVHQQAAWMLGDAPPHVATVGSDYGAEPPYISAMIGRGDASVPAGVEKHQVVFGEDICGDVYLPAGARQASHPLPAVLWLHPWSPANGYAALYRRGDQVQHTLARAGYAVFCFDQIGFGRRIEEAEFFYLRHARWSLLGKCVCDAGAALDVMARLPYIDSARMVGLGYGLGSLVGLHLGAFDDRLSGFASVCGPAAFRLDTNAARTGGLRRWSHDTMLLPRLGLFEQQPDRIPYDVSDLLACYAPHPVLVVSPQLDREAPPELVTPAVDAARHIYALHNALDRLTHVSPEDYNHFGPSQQALVLDWLQRL
ncbi:MAG TPA: hypothetical protein VGK87_00595 [Anaerolineae bacterium]